MILEKLTIFNWGSVGENKFFVQNKKSIHFASDSWEIRTIGLWPRLMVDVKAPRWVAKNFFQVKVMGRVTDHDLGACQSLEKANAELALPEV